MVYAFGRSALVVTNRPLMTLIRRISGGYRIVTGEISVYTPLETIGQLATINIELLTDSRRNSESPNSTSSPYCADGGLRAALRRAAFSCSVNDES